MEQVTEQAPSAAEHSEIKSSGLGALKYTAINRIFPC